MAPRPGVRRATPAPCRAPLRTPEETTMSKRTSKRNKRKKSSANHGKRPNA